MPPATQGPLGPSLRRFRESRGESGKDFALAAGMSPGHLSEIETGRRKLTSALIERIAAAVNLSIEALMGELDRLAVSQPEADSYTLREDPTPYRVQSQTGQTQTIFNEFKDLSEWFVNSMPRSDAWDLIHKFTDLARNGDATAGRCAKALLNLLAENH